MMNIVLRGVLAGTVATGTMTAVLVAGKLGGWVGQEPPKQITKNAERKAGQRPATQTQDEIDAAWIAAHLGFGAACGLGYVLVGRFLPGGTIFKGLTYGELVWAANYLGIMPALGLYPTPENDRTSRAVVMIVAHAVYGVTAAEAEARLHS